MCILSSLIWKKTKKIYRKEKKIWVIERTKPLLCEANYDLKNNNSIDERFTPTSFQIVWCFHKFYMLLFYMLDTVYLWSFFPSITFINYAVLATAKYNLERAWLARVQAQIR